MGGKKRTGKDKNAALPKWIFLVEGYISRCAVRRGIQKDATERGQLRPKLKQSKTKNKGDKIRRMTGIVLRRSNSKFQNLQILQPQQDPSIKTKDSSSKTYQDLAVYPIRDTSVTASTMSNFANALTAYLEAAGAEKRKRARRASAHEDGDETFEFVNPMPVTEKREQSQRASAHEDEDETFACYPMPDLDSLAWDVLGNLKITDDKIADDIPLRGYQVADFEVDQETGADLKVQLCKEILVKARYGAGQRFFEGKIVKVRPAHFDPQTGERVKETYDVLYAEGDKEFEVPGELISPISQQNVESSSGQPPHLCVTVDSPLDISARSRRRRSNITFAGVVSLWDDGKDLKPQAQNPFRGETCARRRPRLCSSSAESICSSGTDG